MDRFLLGPALWEWKLVSSTNILYWQQENKEEIPNSVRPSPPLLKILGLPNKLPQSQVKLTATDACTKVKGTEGKAKLKLKLR